MDPPLENGVLWRAVERTVRIELNCAPCAGMCGRPAVSRSTCRYVCRSATRGANNGSTCRALVRTRSRAPCRSRRRAPPRRRFQWRGDVQSRETQEPPSPTAHMCANDTAGLCAPRLNTSSRGVCDLRGIGSLDVSATGTRRCSSARPAGVRARISGAMSGTCSRPQLGRQESTARSASAARRALEETVSRASETRRAADEHRRARRPTERPRAVRRSDAAACHVVRRAPPPPPSDGRHAAGEGRADAKDSCSCSFQSNRVLFAVFFIRASERARPMASGRYDAMKTAWHDDGRPSDRATTERQPSDRQPRATPSGGSGGGGGGDAQIDSADMKMMPVPGTTRAARASAPE